MKTLNLKSWKKFESAKIKKDDQKQIKGGNSDDIVIEEDIIG